MSASNRDKHSYMEVEMPEMIQSAESEAKAVLISHAVGDKPLAELVARLLSHGTGISAHKVVHSSPERSIAQSAGELGDHLRALAVDFRLIVPLLTPNFFESEICLVELGGIWALDVEAFPVVVPPVTNQRVERLLGSVEAPMIDSPEGLLVLRSRIAKLFGVSSSPELWEEEQQHMVRDLRGLLNPRPVKTVDLDWG